jgi:hypothetical protein
VVEGSTLQLDAEESVLCVGANKRQPIQMWNDNNVAWPGRLTLTNRALYFEVSLNLYKISSFSCCVKMYGETTDHSFASSF